jgi:hypothetical protein
VHFENTVWEQHAMGIGRAYFASIVSYKHKMFMKSTTGHSEEHGILGDRRAYDGTLLRPEVLP